MLALGVVPEIPRLGARRACTRDEACRSQDDRAADLHRSHDAIRRRCESRWICGKLDLTSIEGSGCRTGVEGSIAACPVRAPYRRRMRYGGASICLALLLQPRVQRVQHGSSKGSATCQNKL